MQNTTSVSDIEEAINLCREKVDSWRDELKNHSNKEFSAKRLEGGTTHIIWLCEHSIKDVEPTHVVLRVFQGSGVNDRDEEARLSQFLSEKNLGVSILSDFGTGRVEEFLTGKPLTHKEIAGRSDNPEINWCIAREIGKLHNFDSESPDLKKYNLTDNGPFMHVSMDNWLSAAQKFDFNDEKWVSASTFNEHKSKLANLIHIQNKEKWNQEVEWLKDITSHLYRNVHLVLSHNDINAGNVLWEVKKGQTRAKFIDFEYGGLDYAGFDLGNHFCEHFIDYSVTEWPLFRLKLEHFPQQDYMLKFIEHYMTQRNNISTGKKALGMYYVKSLFAMLNSHMLWSIWDMVQATSDAHGLAFLENCIVRMEEYKFHKETLMKILTDYADSKGVVDESQNKRVVDALRQADESEWDLIFNLLNKLHIASSNRISTSFTMLQEKHFATLTSLGLQA
ncbi:choline/ethanolamine kinase CHK [Acrasis kona]|uniref:ethanolamine kinase n=1 Tax=Acrasis kona TaxID=1008807 RepID=A0AAW2YV27_9EUKA